MNFVTFFSAAALVYLLLRKTRFKDCGVCSLFWALLTPLFSMLVISSFRWETEWKVESSYQLVSLGDKSSMEGSFFLGSGYIGEVEYYSYYYKTVDGGFRKAKRKVFPHPSEDDIISVTVYEEQDRVGGEFRILREQLADQRLRWVTFEPSGRKAQFFIPSGSIRKEFDLR